MQPSQSQNPPKNHKFRLLITLKEGKGTMHREVECTARAAAEAAQEIARNGYIDGEMYKFVINEGKKPEKFSIYPASSILSVSLSLSPGADPGR